MVETWQLQKEGRTMVKYQEGIGKYTATGVSHLTDSDWKVQPSGGGKIKYVFSVIHTCEKA
jgi:hypothetical protein